MIRGTFVLMTLVLATAVLAPLAVVSTLVFPRSGPWRLSRLWSRIILTAAGVRVEAEGTDTLVGLPAPVVVANHCSNFDIYALIDALPVRANWVAKASLFRIPLLGWAMRAAGFVPVERHNRQQAVASLGRAVDILRSGRGVIFFPEGTRSADGRLRPFKKGAFIIALQAGAPVVPVAISGSHRVQARRRIRVLPGTIRVVIGDPVPTAGLDHEDRHRLLARVRENLLAGLDPAQHPA